MSSQSVKTVAKSKTIVVALPNGERLAFYYLCKKTVRVDGVVQDVFLDIKDYLSTFPLTQLGAVIDLLIKTDITVRYYDPEEKNWMAQDLNQGPRKVSGNRDGSFAIPRNLEEFDAFLKE